MIDNNDKNLMNNIINKKSFDSSFDINKSQNTPISEINIIIITSFPLNFL
jgi:hypothetical protein